MGESAVVGRGWNAAFSDLPARLRDGDSAAWPLLGIAVLLAGQASLIFTHAVNWDEFFHFGQLYDLGAGKRVPPLQTLYLRPYAWIVALPGNGVDHVVIARIGQWLCQIGILALIFTIARRFADPVTAALAALAYLATGYIIQHGFALRADPMVTLVLMAGLAVLARRRLGWVLVIATGTCCGLAAMLSIKAVLYAPAFAGLAWLRWREAEMSVGAAVKLALIPVIAVIAFAMFYALHAAAMPGAPDAQVGAATGTAGSAARYMFFLGRPNNLGMLVQGMLTGLGMTALVLIAPLAIARRSGHAGERIALAGLLAPVLTLAFYENTASYYWVFMLAPVAVAVSASLAMARTKLPAAVIAGLLVALSISVFVAENRTIIDNQRRTLAVVDTLFPQPVAYFDHADMIAPFAKRNPFQTPWGVKGYLANGVPLYRKAMEREPVPLLLANWWTLREGVEGVGDRFLPADARALHDNYIEFSGPVWLAGKRLAPGTDRNEEFLIPGSYTVRGGALAVDSVAHEPGEVIRIDRGRHRVTNIGDSEARLVWGDRLEPPQPALDYASWVRF